MGSADHTFERSLADVIGYWEAINRGEGAGPTSQRFAERWGDPYRAHFYGCSLDDMRDWVANGYRFDTIGGLPAIDTPTDRRRYRWTDDPEGEFDLPSYLNGETDYYRKREPKKQRGGVRVEVELGALGSVPADALAQYGQFVGEVIRTIQTRGADLELRIVNRCVRCYSRNGLQNKTVQTDIIVSRFGEKVMVRQWSALFSPGGYRHLGFAARCMAEREGYVVASGMGRSIFDSWGVSWEARSRTLRVGCDARASHFPLDHMRNQLAAIKPAM